jgi:hypothetical protein
MAGRHRKPPSRHHRGRHRQPTSNGRWIAPTLATVAVLAAGGVSAYSALNGSGSAPNHPAIGSSPTPTTTTPPVASPATTAPSAAPTPTAVDKPPRGHVEPAAVRLVVTGHVSWVEVTRPSGHVAFSGLLRHGHRLVYSTGPVHVVVGDAGAVRLDRHGHRHAPLGKPGQVVRFTVR